MFIAREDLSKKILITGAILSGLFIGSVYFYLRLDLVSNFKPYYSKSYAASFFYRLANPYSNLAGLVSYFGGPDEIYRKRSFVPASSVPILTYHGVVGVSDQESVNIETFIDQMETLKKAGWNTVSLEDYYKFYRGETNLPEKSFLLTFDDGRKDSYYPVDPILFALDYKASVYVITKFASLEESTYYLTKNELKRMAKSGRWEVQAHAYEVHDDLAKISAEGELGHALTNLLWLEDQGRMETEEEYRARVTRDLREAKRFIEEEIGTRALAFAFPFGDFGEATKNYPKAKEVILGVASPLYSILFYQTKSGELLTYNYPNMRQGAEFNLARRISVDANWSGEELLKKIEEGQPKSLPYSDDFSSNKGWISSGWGEFGINGGELYLGASPNGTGNVVILDGTGHWRDYEVKAKVRWPAGRNIYIWARYLDEKNYVNCNFAKNLIHIEHASGGSPSVIKGEARAFPYPAAGEEFEIGIYLKGRHVECRLNGETVVATDFINPKLDRGGVGFKTWDPALGVSRATINEINANPVQ